MNNNFSLLKNYIKSARIVLPSFIKTSIKSGTHFVFKIHFMLPPACFFAGTLEKILCVRDICYQQRIWGLVTRQGAQNHKQEVKLRKKFFRGNSTSDKREWGRGVGLFYSRSFRAALLNFEFFLRIRLTSLK